MKTLIAYYSRTGTNEEAAKELQKILEGDIEQIIDTADRSSMFWCAMAAMFRRTTKIEETKKNPADYDLVVVATPLWVGRMPPATRAYLEGNRGKFKEIALLSICMGGAGNKKAIPQFEELAGKKATAALLVKAEEWKKEDTKAMLEGFAKEILKR